MQLSILEDPTAEPISVFEAKCHVRDEDSIEDDLILRLIRSARDAAESFTRRALVRQSLRVTMSGFPRWIELPVSPVRSVTSITYIDSAGTSQTLATSVYQVDLSTSDRAMIKPAYNEVWPDTQPDTYNAVTVNFIAGYAIPFTTDFGADANLLTATAHPLANADVLKVWNTGGKLPEPLGGFANYWVVNTETNGFELATVSAGSPIALTDDNEGDHFAGTIPPGIRSAMLLMIGEWYENRELSIIGTIISEVPLGADSLLWPHVSHRS